MKQVISRNPGCLILAFLLVGGIQPPDNSVGYAVMLGIVILVLIRVLWECTK